MKNFFIFIFLCSLGLSFLILGCDELIIDDDSKHKGSIEGRACLIDTNDYSYIQMTIDEKSVLTSSDGIYRIDDILVGRKEIYAYKSGYKRTSTTVNILADTVVMIEDIILPTFISDTTGPLSK